MHLEHTRSGALWGVAHCNVDPPAWLLPLYWSVSTTAYADGSDIEVTSVGFCTRSAQLGLSPVTLLDGRLDSRRAADRYRGKVSDSQLGLLQRAAGSAVKRRHHRHQPIVVHDPPVNLDRLQHGAEQRQLVEDQFYDRRPPGRLEYRPAHIIRVS